MTSTPGGNSTGGAPARASALTTVLTVSAGVALAGLYVVAAGYLEIRAQGAEDGAQYDLGNQLVGVTTPSPPTLPLAGLAIASLAVVGVVALLPRRATRAQRRVLAGTVALVTLLLVAAGWRSEFAGGPWEWVHDGPTPGLMGALQHAATSPAVHLVCLLCIAVAVVPLGQANSAVLSRAGGPAGGNPSPGRSDAGR